MQAKVFSRQACWQVFGLVYGGCLAGWWLVGMAGGITHSHVAGVVVFGRTMAMAALVAAAVKAGGYGRRHHRHHHHLNLLPEESVGER